MTHDCEACGGNVAPGKQCYACGLKGPAGEGLRVCRRCSECAGAEHHWLEHCDDPAETPPGEDPFVGFACKHCEAKADLCEQCDGPIFPITGVTACAECTANRDDFEP